MPNLTLRNIPEPVMARIREMAADDRRSINSEILVLLERILDCESIRYDAGKGMPAAKAQVKLWEKLSGSWKDSRPASDIAEDIRRHRTGGREVEW